MIFPILSAAFAAICVWLTLRFVNRRERWARRTLAALLCAPVLYVLSFGPWCWGMSRWGPLDEPDMSCSVYLPLVRAWYDHQADAAGEGIRWYANLFSDPTIDPAEVAGTGNMILGNSP